MGAIREIREKLSITQNELAKAVNVHANAISNYEMGIRRPRYEVAMNIVNFARSQGLEVSFEEVVGFINYKRA